MPGGMIQYTDTPTRTAIMSRMTQLRFWSTPQMAMAMATAQMMKVMVCVTAGSGPHVE